LNFNPQDYEFFQVIDETELPEGERLFIEINDEPVVIFNVSGKLYAVEDRCSHDDGPLGEGEIEGNEVICPRHGARFGLQDGQAKSMPAYEDITWYPVRIVNQQIEIGVKK